MSRKDTESGLGPFEKGLDFVLYFKGRTFTIDDVARRYNCSYRQAQRLKQNAERFFRFVPSGFAPAVHPGKQPDYQWQLEECKA